jgi:hypothetical protein
MEQRYCGEIEINSAGMFNNGNLQSPRPGTNQNCMYKKTRQFWPGRLIFFYFINGTLLDFFSLAATP